MMAAFCVAGIDFMKLDFGLKVFGQTFSLEFWTNFHPNVKTKVVLDNF
jgi:hypothetical protein